jgi:hypothetical protein
MLFRTGLRSLGYLTKDGGAVSGHRLAELDVAESLRSSRGSGCTGAGSAGPPSIGRFGGRADGLTPAS